MGEDVCAFVSTCSVCAQFKTSTQPPSGLLQPLSVPKRPTSHMAMDFVTGPPCCDGNTTILTVINQSSKSVHLITFKNFLQLRRHRSWWSHMSLSIMAFLLFVTEVHSSPLTFGKSSPNGLVLLLVYPQASTLKAMDKQSFCKYTYSLNKT